VVEIRDDLHAKSEKSPFLNDLHVCELANAIIEGNLKD
jgi:hypothetical protein